MSTKTSVRLITVSALALSIMALLAALIPAPAGAQQPQYYKASSPCPFFSVQQVLNDPNSDWDGDRVSNVVELYNGLKPCVADSSYFCGVSPAQCIVPTVVYGCNNYYWAWTSVNADPNGDWDGDGVSNAVEARNGADPCRPPCPYPTSVDLALNPNGDWDYDRISNAVEVYQGSNPCDGRSYSYANYNPCPNWTQAHVNSMPNHDWDNDGVTNAKEVWRGTSPCQYNAAPAVTYVPYVQVPQRLPHVAYTAYTYVPPPVPKPAPPRCPAGYPYYHPGNGLCYANPVRYW